MTLTQTNLVAEHHDLIYSVLHKMNLNIEEFYDIAAIGLCKAAQAYNESKGRFSTLAYTVIRNEVILEMRNRNLQKSGPKNVLSLDFSEVEGDENVTLEQALAQEGDLETDVLNKIVLQNFIQTLNTREKDVIFKTYHGLSAPEIARHYNVSCTRIKQIRKKVKDKYIDFVKDAV